MRRVLYSNYDDSLYQIIKKFVFTNAPQRYASAMKYTKKTDRFNSLMSYVLLCSAVGRGVGDFILGRNGKPSLSLEFNNLFFSISHVEGIVVTALSDSPIGIDIEKNRSVTLDLLSVVSTVDEINQLGQLPSALLWTAKESLSKLVNEDCYSAPRTRFVIEGKRLIDEIHPCVIFEYKVCTSHSFCLASLHEEEFSIECIDKQKVLDFLKEFI